MAVVDPLGNEEQSETQTECSRCTLKSETYSYHWRSAIGQRTCNIEKMNCSPLDLIIICDSIECLTVYKSPQVGQALFHGRCN